MDQLQKKIAQTFETNFGRTPLSQRIQDILGEAIELSRWTDMEHLKEEAGDLLSTLLQLYTECGWNPEDLVQNTLNKINRRKQQYQSLGRKIKVAILGGAFDPIHKGHIQLAQFVLNTSGRFDEVWIMPCYKHMFGKKMASFEDRFKMCEIAASVDGRIKVSDYEKVKQFGGETYHLVKQLMEEEWAKHQYEFSFIIAQDNANNFHRWYNFEHLEKMIPFVVVSRKGIKPDPNVRWYLNPPHIYLPAETEIMEVSSSFIRSNISDCWKETGNPWCCHDWVDEEVIKYIQRNELYRS